MVPDTMWVYLLCTAFTILVCDPQGDSRPYRNFSFRDDDTVGGEARQTIKSQLCLVRWCHRFTPQVMLKQHRDGVPAQQHVDPISTVFGCDRIVWARKGEMVNAEGRDQLDRAIKDALHKERGKKAGQQQKRPREQGVTRARAALDKFGRGRYRADDAFAGRAFVDVQSTSVAGTPICVLPVFQTMRHNQWCPTIPAGKPGAAIKAFTLSQGYKLSGYYQLRVNHLNRAKGV